MPIILKKISTAEGLVFTHTRYFIEFNETLCLNLTRTHFYTHTENLKEWCAVETLGRIHHKQLNVVPTSCLSARFCQDLAVSQTADTDSGMLQLLTIVCMGEAQECRLPGFIH